jgi:hypothetical protein
MIGARHSLGSTMSNGGDSAPSKRVISGRRPLIRLPKRPILPEKLGFCEDALSVIATRLPSKKHREALEGLRKV